VKEKYKIFLKTSSILLAEDEINLRESFKRVLLLYVKHVYVASDGLEAYSLYKELRPDILITDIKMPKQNGIELIKKIRKDNNNIPIIVTSAYMDQDLLLESIKLLLVEYVVKPIKESELDRLLQECAKTLLENNSTIKISSTCKYDYENKVLISEGSHIVLTHKEVEFFEILLAHRGNLVTKHSVEDKLYVYKEAPLSALKNLVFKLRKKLPKGTIKTVDKLGYMIK